MSGQILTETENKIYRIDPGIYENEPAEEYHKWPGASASRLKAMSRSPMHCFYEMNHPKDPTPAMLKGTAIHASILEPERFDLEFVPAMQCEAHKKNGDRCTNESKGKENEVWLCNVHGKSLEESTQTILDEEFFGSCLHLRQVVRNHRTMAHFFNSDYTVETSAAWDEAIGDNPVRCKMRSDMLVEELATVIDIKTCEDASKPEFERQIFNYGYHVQAAHYLSGLQALGKEYLHFLFVAVEKSPPYGVAVYFINRSALEAGIWQRSEYLNQWAECQRNNYWPGYPDGLQEIDLPLYAKRQIYKTA